VPSCPRERIIRLLSPFGVFGIGLSPRLRLPGCAPYLQCPLALPRQSIPRLCHFEELVALLARLHLFGERAALLAMPEIILDGFHG
jgi:hypothetical protein